MNVPHLRDLMAPRRLRTWLLALPRCQGTRRQVAKIPRRLAAWQAWQSLVFKRVDRSHSNVRFFGYTRITMNERVIIKDAKIVFLDESTNQLDNTTEQNLQLALEQSGEWCKSFFSIIACFEYIIHSVDNQSTQVSMLSVPLHRSPLIHKIIPNPI